MQLGGQRQYLAPQPSHAETLISFIAKLYEISLFIATQKSKVDDVQTAITISRQDQYHSGITTSAARALTYYFLRFTVDAQALELRRLPLLSKQESAPALRCGDSPTPESCDSRFPSATQSASGKPHLLRGSSPDDSEDAAPLLRAGSPCRLDGCRCSDTYSNMSNLHSGGGSSHHVSL